MKSLKQKLKRVRPLLGTFVEIELHGIISESTLNAWITAGFRAIETIDRLMSRYRPDSDVSRLNRAQPRVWVEVNLHTRTVLQASNKLYNNSHGIFDIRCAKTLTDLKPPIQFRGSRVRKTGPWTFDLGGIAKGYAVDCAVETIKGLSKGYSISGIVNAGGDLRRWGRQWPAVAVATSAVRHAQNAERLSQAEHIHMPSGKVLKKENAVSVISSRCLWSDALTKVMLLAPPHIAKRCLKVYHSQALALT